MKRNKTDGRDAEAICEAMQRPSMRFVAVKSAEQQAVLAGHRARARLVRQRTMAADALRARFAEFGVVAAQGRRGRQQLRAELAAPEAVPAAAQPAPTSLARHGRARDADIAAREQRIVQAVRTDAVARRLRAIPGGGPIGARAVLATLPDAKSFRSGRGFAAWLGLTPRQNHGAGKRRSGGISKQGQRRLRSLLIVGASAHLRQERARGVKNPWLAGLPARRPVKGAAVARAAKTARIIWAMLARDEVSRATPAQAA